MSPQHDSPRGTASRNGLEIVTELSRRFAAGDGAGALALFHPDIRIEQPASLPHGGSYHGHTGVAAMGESFGRYWERSIDNPRIFGSEESVVQLTTQTWTAKESGRHATVDVVELFSFADGMVREIRVFQQDTHALLETLQPR
ncbi:nuclear transport factor 2 family protein [Nocardia nova]|jgi:ketosteroid isomerase-like protein|uniref:nuclear transport factor 2 family protein n=1 Tax=Nocardia nova TaxID=37330 RepID=UPI0018945BF7|nr:nuclear transport factor 2 family protein [Nocardia nova]MBF6146997.1 nuclear transport factor 2 family protein [Nocardia nova]MDN2497625.1 nuclear transport factor 2 family protein [Nocardia nova]